MRKAPQHLTPPMIPPQNWKNSVQTRARVGKEMAGELTHLIHVHKLVSIIRQYSESQ